MARSKLSLLVCSRRSCGARYRRTTRFLKRRQTEARLKRAPKRREKKVCDGSGRSRFGCLRLQDPMSVCRVPVSRVKPTNGGGVYFHSCAVETQLTAFRTWLAGCRLVSSSYFRRTGLVTRDIPATSCRRGKRRTATALIAPERAAVREQNIEPSRRLNPPVLAVAVRHGSLHLLAPTGRPPLSLSVARAPRACTTNLILSHDPTGENASGCLANLVPRQSRALPHPLRISGSRYPVATNPRVSSPPLPLSQFPSLAHHSFPSPPNRASLPRTRKPPP